MLDVVICGKPQLRPEHAEGLQHPECGGSQDLQLPRRRQRGILQRRTCRTRSRASRRSADSSYLHGGQHLVLPDAAAVPAVQWHAASAAAATTPGSSTTRFRSITTGACARALPLLANYTLSKQMEQWGFNDPYTECRAAGPVLPRPPARVQADRRSGSCLSAKARSFGASTNKFAKKLISGWQCDELLRRSAQGLPR